VFVLKKEQAAEASPLPLSPSFGFAQDKLEREKELPPGLLFAGELCFLFQNRAAQHYTCTKR